MPRHTASYWFKITVLLIFCLLWRTQSIFLYWHSVSYNLLFHLGSILTSYKANVIQKTLGENWCRKRDTVRQTLCLFAIALIIIANVWHLWNIFVFVLFVNISGYWCVTERECLRHRHTFVDTCRLQKKCMIFSD